MKCCINCFSVTEIQDFIMSIGNIKTCDYCHSKNVHCADVEDVGKFIREGISRAYEPVDGGTGSIYDPEDKCYSDPGDSIEEILKWELGIFSDYLDAGKDDELCSDLLNESGPSIHDIQHGDSDWMTENDLVMQDAIYGFEITSEYGHWEAFKYTCKHFNRFFDLEGRNSSRAKMLSHLNGIFFGLQQTLPKGSELFRGRVYELPKGNTLSSIDILQEISPPPPNYARNSRMSPAGISYTYLANNKDTCISEIKIPNNGHFIMGRFITKRKLKILDLTRDLKYVIKSCFSPEYDHSQNWLGDFVRRFSGEISKPINENEKELDYVATQLLAEYIRKIGFHGVKFKSSMHSSGINYVLFCSINPDITNVDNELGFYYDKAIIPFTKWLNLVDIEYCGLQQKSYFIDKVEHNDKKAKYHSFERKKCGAIKDKSKYIDLDEL